MKVLIPCKRVNLGIPGKKSIFSNFGLMFRKKPQHNILFEFREDVQHRITSYFVYEPFLAIFLDQDNVVIDCRVIHPWVLGYKPCVKYRKVLEVPLFKF